jgi:hypothetical protein
MTMSYLPGTLGDWPIWGPAVTDRRTAIRMARALAYVYGGVPVYRVA